MAKLRVAVFFGGISSEHEVSCMSAASVLENLSADQYDILPIGITKKGRWLYFPGNFQKIPTGEWESDPDCIPAFLSPDRAIKGLLMTPQGKNCYTQRVDVAFPVLHGKYGEDGTIQGLFMLAGIPYVGCDTLSSAVCMDKEVTNSLLDYAGIPHTPWGVIRRKESDRIDEFADLWEIKLGYPMFVKPANAGSSVGVSKAKDRAALKEAVQLAFAHDSKAIVEKAIVGKELECAVLGNDNPEASVVSEIIPGNEFYDYEAKYNSPSVTHLPARIDDSLSDTIRNTAIKAYSLLECSGMARVDFLFEESSKSLYLNELNTIPGFTSISMYAKMMAASGTPYPLLLEKLIGLAIEKSEHTY